MQIDKELLNKVKELEKELKESKNFLQNIFNVIQDGISILDSDLNIVMVNQWMEKAYSEAAPFVGKKCFTVYQGRTSPCPFCPSIKTLETGKSCSESVPYPSAENLTGWLELTAFPLTDEHGTLIGVIEYVKDITDRRQAEAELLATKARLQHLLTSTPAVIYSCRTSGDFGATFISDNIKMQLGYDPQEFVEDPNFWIDTIHPEDRPRVISGLSSLFKKGYHIHEYRFQHKDGSYRWMLDELRLVSDADGNPLEIVGYWTDITERKQAEEELKRAHAELEKRVKERTAELEETNVTLKVLLKKREDDKRQLEEQMVENVTRIIEPSLEKLKKSRLDENQKKHLDIIETMLQEIISPLVKRLSSKYLNFTPTEINVANLIKQGKPTKEIADLLSLAPGTISAHRKNIRKKMGITNQSLSLQTILASHE